MFDQITVVGTWILEIHKTREADLLPMWTSKQSIQSEHETIANLGPRQYLAVNQAQRTGVFSGSAIIDTLLGWSLLAMARQGNPSIVKHPNFQLWLTTMPIVMVDYATSQHHDFNTMLNEAVTTYNANLI
jgi:hypothetical protein